MTNSTALVDTNILVRYLTNDSLQLSNQAKQLFKKAKKNELELPNYILCELVWVLLSYYEQSKDQVITTLKAILAFDKFALNRKLLRKAVQLFEQHNISFIDALLLAEGEVSHKRVESSDKRVSGLSSSGGDS